MIARYFTICELLGYFSIFLFLTNILILANYYVKLFKNKKRVISWVWFSANVLLIAGEIITTTLFIYDLIDPYHFSKQGKIDLKTASDFISFSVSLIVISCVSALIINICQPLFGTYIKGNKIFISYQSYEKKDFKVNKHWIKYGKKHKWKSFPKIGVAYKYINSFINK